ncbi:MAG TPA: glycosyltransferase family 4 protein [Rhodospirillaceae bacterium]|nr:glycosyltransferase family 4 protein [Rhodospirillaceae bacterium]
MILLLGRHAFDRLWLEKDALPFLPWAVERPLLSGRPLVVDFDDAWYLRYAGRPLLDGKLEALAHRAETTIAGNETLAQWAGRAGANNIVQLPTAVDPARYAGEPGSGATPPVVGWIGTPSSARDHLLPLAPLLAELVTAGRIQLTVVGARLDLPATFLPWSEDGEADLVRGFDIGIMPLPDDAWSRGKCAYKLIQYLAAGLPVVASPVGMNCEVVEPGVNGSLAATPEAWREALTSLAADPALRRRMGEAGRQLVKSSYATKVVGSRLLTILRNRS